MSKQAVVPEELETFSLEGELRTVVFYSPRLEKQQYALLVGNVVLMLCPFTCYGYAISNYIGKDVYVTCKIVDGVYQLQTIKLNGTKG